jgi:beta-D-xylosidase 4
MSAQTCAVAFLLLASAPSSSADTGEATLTTCIPATLGSESFRRNQVWEYTAGRIKQPAFPDLCLTTTNLTIVQGKAGIMVLPCQTTVPEVAANQTWELSPLGQLIQGGRCIDVAGYSTSPGAQLHLWRCTPVIPPPPPPQTSKNQQWEWNPDGSVRSLMSGLCLSAGPNVAPPKVCELAPMNASQFCNVSLSPEQRAAALIADTNLTERVSNLAVGGPGFPRLGVPAPTYSEALHGVCCSCGTAHPPNPNEPSPFASTGCATSFPHALAMAATFNRSMWHAVGDAIGREARALHNQHPARCGATFFAPNINLYRDPRWGRGMEVPGEDPLTTGEYGREFVRAVQQRSDDGRTQRVVAAPKHFLDYDMEGRHDTASWWGPSRNDFDAKVSKQEQVEYFLPAWHATIKAGRAGSLMCSTNRVNGVDACMNPTFLTGFLRKEFNFGGYVVTDGNSCGNTNCRATVENVNASAGQAWGKDGHEIAAGLCLKAGTDVELGVTLSGFTAGAIADGYVGAGAAERSNTRLYSELIRSGYVDRTALDELGPADVDTAAHRQLAFEAAADATVLLKNDGALLPLPANTPGGLKIALVGPHLNSTEDLLSGPGYAGENRLVGANKIEAAFRRRAAASTAGNSSDGSGDGSGITIVGAALGCDIGTGCSSADVAAVAGAVADADVVVAFVGLHPTSGAPTAPGYGTACAESESFDRGDIALCGQQEAVLRAALEHSGGKPLVTVMINGGTIASPWIKEHSTAILQGWYPGQAGGEALVAVLLGDRQPTGRLPVTIYDESLIANRNSSEHNITDMSLRSVDGLTYMHYRGAPLWPFGFGMAYTEWAASLAAPTELTMTTAQLATDYARYYSPLLGPGPSAPALPTKLTVAVTNAGRWASAVVVQVFASLAPNASALGGGGGGGGGGAGGGASASATSASASASASGGPPPCVTATLPPPLRQLVGFERAAALGPGETRRVAVGLAPLALCPVDGDGNQWAAGGVWQLAATVDGLEMLAATLTVTGPAVQVLRWPSE